ncbi:MAG: peptide ABC transporter substrate-binding protein, partial [Chloroflexia bacterium]|nr:peptide ABC transporter substrate-binding protein [Chloroflexia bacterium]
MTSPEPAAPLVVLDEIRMTFATRTGLFRRGEVRALRGVNLAIANGETVALV